MARVVDIESIGSYFQSLDDPRHAKNRKHRLVDVTVIAMCGVLCGCGGPTAIHRVGGQPPRLKVINHGPLPSSDGSLRRVLLLGYVAAVVLHVGEQLLHGTALPHAVAEDQDAVGTRTCPLRLTATSARSSSVRACSPLGLIAISSAKPWTPSTLGAARSTAHFSALVATVPVGVTTPLATVAPILAAVCLAVGTAVISLRRAGAYSNSFLRFFRRRPLEGDKTYRELQWCESSRGVGNCRASHGSSSHAAHRTCCVGRT